MEYLVRSLAVADRYVSFEHPEEPEAARCAVFQAHCAECEKDIPAEGPSVTFRTPSANPGEAVTYLVTVCLDCVDTVARRIRVSRGEECGCGQPRDYFLHLPVSACLGACGAPQDHHKFGEAA